MSNLAAELAALRIAAGRTEAFASIAVQLYDDGAGSGSDLAQSERVAYLLRPVAGTRRRRPWSIGSVCWSRTSSRRRVATTGSSGATRMTTQCGER